MARAAPEGIRDGSGPTQTDGSGHLLCLFIEADECRGAVTNSERDGKKSSYTCKGNKSGVQHGCLNRSIHQKYREQLSHCPIHTPCSACPAAVPCGPVKHELKCNRCVLKQRIKPNGAEWWLEIA